MGEEGRDRVDGSEDVDLEDLAIGQADLDGSPLDGSGHPDAGRDHEAG